MLKFSKDKYLEFNKTGNAFIDKLTSQVSWINLYNGYEVIQKVRKLNKYDKEKYLILKGCIKPDIIIKKEWCINE